PTLGIARGKVVDSQTRLGLDGVIVTLSGPSNPVPVSTSAGSFEFRDLLPGAYTLQLSLSQYGTMTFTTSLAPGQSVDSGAVALTKNSGATTGTVRGQVTSATTGAPLAGATVSLTANSLVWTGGTCCGQDQPQFIHDPQALLNYYLTAIPQ